MKHLLEVPSHNLESLVRRQRMDRKAATRSGWMRAFWAVLGELMGQPDAIDNPYAPRNFGRFYAVLLLNHVGRPDDEGDPFIPHIGPLPVTPESPPPYQWTYQRSDSPVAAAEAVAAKLREHGVEVSEAKKDLKA